MIIINKFKKIFKTKKPEMVIEIPFSFTALEDISKAIRFMEEEHSANYTLKFHIITK